MFVCMYVGYVGRYVCMYSISTSTPQFTSIKGLMVSIRWYLGSLKG